MKERILETASHLIEKYGLRRFTLDEISRMLSISKKTIYVYFHSKNDIISAYFDAVLESDKQHTLKQLDKAELLDEKLQAIIFSSHDFKLPLIVIEEAERSYPKEWEKVEKYRLFKVALTREILENAKDDGLIRATVDFTIVSYMLEKISSMIYNPSFLIDNDLTLKQALLSSVDLIMNGIRKND
ncbi:TetR/AcrR family transcriptional regulator [Niallia sp. 01092]|uniref:TetR/AcrR family transcriptional regulator n=1 Tax=unclassified Niallia TaxID=2837522 RepID=UPI003FD50DDA